MLEAARLRWDGKRETARPDNRLTEDSIATLCGRLSGEISALVRDEMRLLRTELRVKAIIGIRAALFLAVAACIGMFALTALVATVILALALVMPAWLSTLIVAVVGGGIASMLAFIALRTIRRAMPLVPHDSIAYAERFSEQIGETVSAIREKTNVPLQIRRKMSSLIPRL